MPNPLPHLACSIAAALPLLAPAHAGTGEFNHGPLHVHEFLASNSSGLLDEDGDTSDWIEIWNGSPGPVDLAGWHLSDDLSDLTRWTLPSRVVPAGGALVVFASGKDRLGSELHTNFKLSASGEDLCLTRPDGFTLESAYFDFPPQSADVSFGLKDTQPDEGYFTPPTPGQANGDQFASLAQVQFSKQRGHRQESFVLSLTHSDANAQLQYTLDGSAPSNSNSQTYSAPIIVDGTAVVRARAVRAFMSPSPVATHTFLFAGDTLAQTHAGVIADGYPANWVEEDGTDWDLGGGRPGAWYGMDATILASYPTAQLQQALLSAPTVSLSMSPDDWFGDGSAGPIGGIYCNSEATGSAWQRSGSMEWIDSHSSLGFGVDCGLSIQGSSSTDPILRNQLSIKLSFKGEFGPKKLKQDIFDGSVASFDHLILDAGHQNSPNGPGSNKLKRHAQGLRDQFMCDVQDAMGGLAPRGRPVHLYINGLYWGLYNIHERANEQFAAAHGGGKPTEYDYVKEGVVREGNSNDWDDANAPGAWDTAVTIAAGGLDTTDIWQGQPAYEVFCQWFDVADYAEYLLLNYFGGNTDWPQNNWIGSSHSRLSADYTDTNPAGAFRWHSWDAETVLYWGNAATSVGDGFYDRTSETSTWIGSIVYFYTFLRVNPEWRMLFADLAHEQIFHGALFVDPDYAAAGTPYDPAFPERNTPATLYYQRAQELWPAVILEYARWGNYWHAPGTITPADWLVERDRLLEQYFPVRSDVLLAQLRNVQPQLYPDLDAPELSPHGGAVRSNEDILLSGPPGATLYYTLDGSDPRLAGGILNPSALAYQGPFTLPGPTCSVRARAYDGSEWSALERGNFAVDVPVVLNELQASNKNTILDENGQSEDWVELTNTSDQGVDLSGWGLSDDTNRPGKWRFPEGTVIGPRAYLLVWLDEDGSQGPLHANFKLAASGESISLCGPAATGDVPVDFVTFGPQTQDRSFGRMPNGKGPFRTLVTPSPWDPNLRGQAQ
jgi:hypothetical protein